jgi:hypothetical protein
MNINPRPEMFVVQVPSMNQSLYEAFELATIQLFSIDVVGVEVAYASLDASAAVSAALEGSLPCLLKQFSVVCPRRWQRNHFRISFPLSPLLSLLSSLLSLSGLLPTLPPLPPLPPFFAKS